jgi:hypothetical protein
MITSRPHVNFAGLSGQSAKVTPAAHFGVAILATAQRMWLRVATPFQRSSYRNFANVDVIFS